jgi:mono/diheme cytochrome c family protein
MATFLVRAAIAASFVLVAAPALAQIGPNTGTTKMPAPVTGEQVFQQVCKACHMADARGATGAATIPALADNPHLSDASYPITMVLYGRGAMPWFSEMLTPVEIANVVAYVRTHFGNNYPGPVTETDVTLLAGAKASK